jgi:uncharacterized protein (DUF2235 family)
LGRKIIVLSDGTGHGARKLFRTNVWRIYQALNLSGATQIALYDDGVGTSKFKLLAMLGGGFGWGLKRNVIGLYTFLCQNYNDGDDIYAFGFSRGAFTVRVLIKFVLSEGIVTDFYSQDDLNRKARYLYRRFRGKRKTKTGIEGVGRWVRDGVLIAWDIMNRSLVSRTPKTRSVKRVKFVGVWDTVDAYFLPILEFKLGIDNYLWPLALEDRVLDPAVEKVCHALSIDDKRHTFHPLLWDESDATQCPITDSTDDERLTQIWFAGVHTNVGGGYPDDGLSHVSLCWMIEEAQKKGLTFDASAVAQIKSARSPYGRIYNSRAGFGAYYRYDPRRLDPPTDSQGASIPFPKVHSSVFWRIAYGSDSYAPLNLPRHMRVVTAEEYDHFAPWEHSNNETAKNIFSFEKFSEIFEDQAKEVNSNLTLSAPSDDVLALIWDTVWWRRIVYFATLTLTLYLFVLPFFPALEFDLWTFLSLPFEALTGHLFEGPSNLSHLFGIPLRAITRVAEALLPSFVTPFIDAINSKPNIYLPWLIALLACLGLGSLIDRRIQDRALAAWSPKWRHMRYLWSREAARPRVVMAIAATMLLSAYISIFFAVTERVKDGERCHFEIACLLRGAKGALSKDPWGIYILFRMYFVVLLLVAAALVLWAYFKLGIETAPSHPNEIRGFLLWLAHSTRRRQRLVQSHGILVKSVIPFAFAAAVVVAIACISNQASLSIMEYTGLLCRPPAPVWYTHASSADPKDTIVIHQPLNDYCGLVEVNPTPAPNTTYKVVINYSDVPTDRKRLAGFLTWDYLVDVSVTLREISESIAAVPFRRRIDQPWHVIIAKDAPIGGQEKVLTVQETEITTGPQGLLYLFANEPVIALPFLYDRFYRGLKGTAEITLIPKISSESSVKSPTD